MTMMCAPLAAFLFVAMGSGGAIAGWSFGGSIYGGLVVVAFGLVAAGGVFASAKGAFERILAVMCFLANLWIGTFLVTLLAW